MLLCLEGGNNFNLFVSSDSQIRVQYSPLILKNDPRIVPASLDFCLANLNFPSNSFGTSIPSESLKPTARFLGHRLYTGR